MSSKYTFEALELGKMPNSKDVLIAVIQEDSQGNKTFLGTYDRNYHCMYNTFHSFEQEGRYFALYSYKYVATSIMEIIPNVGFVYLGGEDFGNRGGFCPTDYYVPNCEYLVDDKDLPLICDNHTIIKKEKGFSEVVFPQYYGFVSGCHWGDDSSWKIQYLDLSDVANGNVKRKELFGYLELPREGNLRLKDVVEEDCLSMDGFINKKKQYEGPVIISSLRRFHI